MILVSALLVIGSVCIDQTDEGQTRRANRLRDSSRIDRIVLHRFGPEVDGKEILGAKDAAKAFSRTGSWRAGAYTAGKTAYHFLYDLDSGLVYQALPLDRVGVHAIGYNQNSVAVALLASKGEAYSSGPHWENFYTWMARLRTHLQYHSGNMVPIHGHMELPGASRDPFKDCPGHGIDMKQLRNKVYLLGGWMNRSIQCIKEEQW